MARKPRIHYEGALYHVICRGNNREFIFEENKWKQTYLQIIMTYKKRYNFKLYAYVIMDNHVHLLIEVDHVPLSKIMQGIQQVFTQKYNRGNRHTGHVFEQRYKAILCDKDLYLLMLIRYIHQNPVRIYDARGLSYPWSSYLSYLSDKENLFVNKAFPLSLFDNSIKKFQVFMEEEETEIEKMKSQELSEHIDEYAVIRKQNEKEGSIPLKDVIEKVCLFYSIEMQELTKRTQQRQIVRARSAVIYLMEGACELSSKELANTLNISAASVSATFANKKKRDELEADVRKIRDLIKKYNVSLPRIDTDETEERSNVRTKKEFR